MDYRKLESHAKGMYPTQDTSYMGKTRMKQEEEEEDTRIMVKEYKKYGRKERGYYTRKSTKEDLTD